MGSICIDFGGAEPDRVNQGKSRTLFQGFVAGASTNQVNYIPSFGNEKRTKTERVDVLGRGSNS
jgi:hypothetical protein